MHGLAVENRGLEVYLDHRSTVTKILVQTNKIRTINSTRTCGV